LIHSAAAAGVVPVVKFLIDLGADPMLRDPTYGGDAIGWAEHHDRQEMVEYLKTLRGRRPAG
jgi:ankyrin repeat protein